MAVRKFAPVQTAKDRAIADRIKRAKAVRSPVERSTNYHEPLGELARAAGVTFDVVYEEWSERAGVREYDGNVSKDEAEFEAMGDVRQRLHPTPRTSRQT